MTIFDCYYVLDSVDLSDHILKFRFLNSFPIGYNDLTGSVPSELSDKNYAKFDLYGNQLSDLTPVDGKVVCSAEEGEHYCDCENDCALVDLNLCACEEGQSCCATWMEQFTPCIICEYGLENPDFYVPEYFITCFQVSEYINSAPPMEFGTETQCGEARIEVAMEGCICKDDASDDSAEATETIGI